MDMDLTPLFHSLPYSFSGDQYQTSDAPGWPTAVATAPSFGPGATSDPILALYLTSATIVSSPK